MAWTWVRPADPSLLKAAPLLDVGTGDGQTALALAGPLSVGLDSNLEALRAARQAGMKRLVSGSALHLPFASSAFRTVLAADMIHHLPDDALDVLLAEVRRVLQPSGRFVAWWYAESGRGGPGDPNYVRSFQQVAERLKPAGFDTQPLQLHVSEGVPATAGLVASARI